MYGGEAGRRDVLLCCQRWASKEFYEVPRNRSRGTFVGGEGGFAMPATFSTVNKRWPPGGNLYVLSSLTPGTMYLGVISPVVFSATLSSMPRRHYALSKFFTELLHHDVKAK